MRKIFHYFLIGALIGALLVTGAGLINLTRRVVLLEQRCDSRCLYGDKDCAARCAKAGHCPFQKEN